MANLCTSTISIRIEFRLRPLTLHGSIRQRLLRQLLGIETQTVFERIDTGYQRILDNLHLLDDSTIIKINDVVVSFGHNEVFKKRRSSGIVFKNLQFCGRE